MKYVYVCVCVCVRVAVNVNDFDSIHRLLLFLSTNKREFSIWASNQAGCGFYPGQGAASSTLILDLTWEVSFVYCIDGNPVDRSMVSMLMRT